MRDPLLILGYLLVGLCIAAVIMHGVNETKGRDTDPVAVAIVFSAITVAWPVAVIMCGLYGLGKVVQKI